MNPEALQNSGCEMIEIKLVIPLRGHWKNIF
jgi:hypothetical protein